MSKEKPDQLGNGGKSVTRRFYLQGLTAAGVGLGGLSMTTGAQTEDSLPAPFCGDAATGPTDPPGQAGQCIDCVREVCENEPVAVALFSGGLSGQCFTLSPEEIPENADYITLKAGQYCFLGEVPEDPQEDVTWCIEQSNGQPDRLPDISNVTLYTCPDEAPPSVDDVDVTCEQIVITTSNIDDGETLDVTVDFSDGSTEEYTPTVTDNQATVTLPGDRDPVDLRIEYDGLILFDAGVAASDAPCGDNPAVTDIEVTCAQITIQTTNIDEGEQLDVTVDFTDGSTETYISTVGATGVVTVELPGDRDPERLTVEYEGLLLFDQLVAAADAPCRRQPECPPGLDIVYKYYKKKGKWCPKVETGGDPDAFSIEGDRKKVTISAPFPFAVSYAVQQKKHDKCYDGQKDTHHKNCKEQDPVLAEPVDGQYCATISCKKKICWFRVFCPEDNSGDPVSNS
ncbi:hypothetical protein [Natronococcus jeotgali]|uniref:hypothetical protein n=1 Tax=Natronococcus jeotgali TaxID=413812 RepID=UPI001269788C|nr:hypothetical protein [Natronococcus jeotgali]